MRQVRIPQSVILFSLCAILPIVIVYPLMVTLLENALSGRPMAAGPVEAVAPITWRSRFLGSGRIELWLPCKTVFCGVSESSIRIYFDSSLVGKKDAWMSLALKHLQSRADWVEDPRQIDTDLGAADCILSHGKNDSNYLECVCLIESKGVTAAFAGKDTDFKTFKAIVGSLRSRHD